MDYQNPPEIVITTTEHHQIQEEVIEHVARLLARADGADPDGNIQCGEPRPGETVVTCTLMALPYPSDRVWNRYRPQAEKLLRDIFAK